MASFRILRSLACVMVVALPAPAALAQPYADRGASFWSRAGGNGILVPYLAPWSVPETQSRDVESRRVSYPIETGWVRVVPTVVYVPEPGAHVPGVVSIGLERAEAGDPWRLKAELGWSGRPGASLDLDYRVPDRQASFKAEDRPTGAIALPNGRAPGSTWAGVWTERLGARTTASLAMSGDRLHLEGREPEATSGRVDIRHRATDAWNLLMSVTGSSYAEPTGPELRRGVATVGTEFSAGALGVAAMFRDESSSSSSGSGRGGRLTLRASQGEWHASVYADAQQQAATLELNTPGPLESLQPSMDLGLVGASPERAVQMFRDRSRLLAQQGIELGELRVDPLRVQGGLDLKWRHAGAQRTEVGLRLAMDDLQGTDAPRRALLGHLHMSWRVLDETDLTASYASWMLQSDPQQDDSRSLFLLSVRSRL